MANVTLFGPAGNYSRITIVPSQALLAYLARKGYTVVASAPVNKEN
jgi:hypothetical protein